MLVLCDADGFLRAVDWKDCEPRMHELLRRQYGAGAWRSSTRARPRRRAARSSATSAGELGAIDALPTRTAGTVVPARGLGGAPRDPGRPDHELRRARPARSAGPRAVRAVGAANGANPIGIVVPCHRVVGADGSLTGYGGGLHRKRWLLDHERTHRLESAGAP